MPKKKLNTTAKNLPLYLFHQGTNYNAYEYMGAHLVDEKTGETVFRTWAPKADSVSLVGDFNNWDENANVLTRVSDGGVFEISIKGFSEFDNYKFAVKNNGKTILKADPYAFHSETPPFTASKIYSIEGYNWGDDDYDDYEVSELDYWVTKCAAKEGNKQCIPSR